MPRAIKVNKLLKSGVENALTIDSKEENVSPSNLGTIRRSRRKATTELRDKLVPILKGTEDIRKDGTLLKNIDAGKSKAIRKKRKIAIVEAEANIGPDLENVMKDVQQVTHTNITFAKLKPKGTKRELLNQQDKSVQSTHHGIEIKDTNLKTKKVARLDVITNITNKTKSRRKKADPKTKRSDQQEKESIGSNNVADKTGDLPAKDNGDDKFSQVSKGKQALNTVDTVYRKSDFDIKIHGNEEAKNFNFKISSWNVAGLRSWVKKSGFKFLDYEEPDIFCMQEIKCSVDQLPKDALHVPGYHPYWLCLPGGYAGVAIYSKIMPINVEYGIGNSDFDLNGRIITAEYEKFFLVNVYVPNSGRKLVNLESRMIWEDIFSAHVQKLDAIKPIIICGDMNVAHLEWDLANPKTNTRNAGFTKEERDKMSEMLSHGFIDTFRYLYPQQKHAYTFWTYIGNARKRNVGWRLDYFIVSKRLINRVVDSCMRSQCFGSDHCPITLFLKF